MLRKCLKNVNPLLNKPIFIKCQITPKGISKHVAQSEVPPDRAQPEPLMLKDVAGSRTISTLSPDPFTSVECASCGHALICEEKRMPMTQQPILVFPGKRKWAQAPLVDAGPSCDPHESARNSHVRSFCGAPAVPPLWVCFYLSLCLFVFCVSFSPHLTKTVCRPPKSRSAQDFFCRWGVFPGHGHLTLALEGSVSLLLDHAKHSATALNAIYCTL